MRGVLVLIAGWIARAHDLWRTSAARLRPLSVQVSLLEEQTRRLRAENELLRARLRRVAPRHRRHYLRHERLDILWHAARYALSVKATARAFVISVGTVVNWKRALREDAPVLRAATPPANKLPALLADLARRLRREWPQWGTRRIAGVLLRLGLCASRTTVRAFLRAPARRDPPPAPRPCRAAHLVAKRPDHLWFMDFTRVGGLLRSVVVGAVVDAFSRKVLALRVAPREPRATFAVRLLRAAVRRAGRAPGWMVTDRGSQFRAGALRRALRSLGIRHRRGAVHRHGSVAVIERFWKSMKAEYAWSLCVWRPLAAIERSLANYVRWFNGWRPHQGLGQRTPAELHAQRSSAPRSVPLRAVLVAERVAGDRLLPVLSLRLAA